MVADVYNPCAECPRNCCKGLKFLKLSPAEYQRVYEPYRGQFDIQQQGKVYELTMHKGLSCPHLGDLDLCTMYETRPYECRLFPYTVNRMYRFGPIVLFSYHGRAGCPRKEDGLFPSRKTARHLVYSLARETYGPHKLYWVCYEGIVYRVISRGIRALHLRRVLSFFRR